MTTAILDHDATAHSAAFQALPLDIREDLEWMLNRRSNGWHGGTICENREAAQDFDRHSNSVRIDIDRLSAGHHAGKVCVTIEALRPASMGRRRWMYFDDAVEAIDYMAAQIARFA